MSVASLTAKAQTRGLELWKGARGKPQSRRIVASLAPPPVEYDRSLRVAPCTQTGLAIGDNRAKRAG
ncbi:hypothetical protein ColKHC_13209 [Colletotrichum higginsianum]|nr:hypothetical protein ColKHC_13209 [Colletotrichum higginsianum]